jgi:hypothetical protein
MMIPPLALGYNALTTNKLWTNFPALSISESYVVGEQRKSIRQGGARRRRASQVPGLRGPSGGDQQRVPACGCALPCGGVVRE